MIKGEINKPFSNYCDIMSQQLLTYKPLVSERPMIRLSARWACSGGGIYISAWDLARLGYLFLREGQCSSTSLRLCYQASSLAGASIRQ